MCETQGVRGLCAEVRRLKAVSEILRLRAERAEAERDALQAEMARLRSDLDIEREQSAKFVKEIERLRIVDAGAAMMRRVLNEVGRSVVWASAARECLRSDAGKAFMGQLIDTERELADEAAKAAALREDVGALQRDISASEKECRALRVRVAAVGRVLSENGCDCECGCFWDEHGDDCDRCLACRVEDAIARREDVVVEGEK